MGNFIRRILVLVLAGVLIPMLGGAAFSAGSISGEVQYDLYSEGTIYDGIQ